MVIISAKGLSFRYQQLEACPLLPRVLDGVNLEVERGAFCVLTGPTGCGKSTLLRLLQPALAPRGVCEGTLEVDGVTLLDGATYQRAATPSVAFVSQDPQAQTVCDTVRAELAFGLENQGVPPAEMARRMAEAAGFLGIDSWMNRRIAQLSGGERQLLNVACALALQPHVLLLDEPTAQLDPHARRRLLAALASINGELGVTVIVATHSPEIMAPMTTQSFELAPLPPLTMPAHALTENCPGGRSGEAVGLGSRSGEAVCLRRVSFRYGRQEPWVVDDVSLALRAGEVHALVGGNGSGKTTLLKLAAGVLKPLRGQRVADARRQAYLPQDPKALFACDSVRDELHEWRHLLGYTSEEEQQVIVHFGLSAVLDQHPYDLSGGQQQKLALAKLLLGKPQVLFLDEPTKGLDAQSVADVAGAVREIAQGGASVMVATHDISFVQAVASTVSLAFDGNLACTLPTREFFEGGLVYRMDAESRLFGAM